MRGGGVGNSEQEHKIELYGINIDVIYLLLDIVALE